MNRKRHAAELLTAFLTDECGIPSVSHPLKLRSKKRKGIAYFVCCCGTQLQGKSYSVCKQDGNWTDFPTCKSKYDVSLMSVEFVPDHSLACSEGVNFLWSRYWECFVYDVS